MVLQRCRCATASPSAIEAKRASRKRLALMFVYKFFAR
jgi:hypothetical protein